MQIEMKSNTPIEKIEVGGQRYLRGYAVRFYNGSPETEGYGPGYMIRIESNAFDKVMNDNVALRFNHSREFTLGNKSTGLTVHKDQNGIVYDHPWDEGDVDFQRIEQKMKKGLITGSSWKGDANVRWHSEGDKDIATVFDVFNFEDVGPCDIPACSGVGSPVIMSANTQSSLDEQYRAWVETKKRLDMTI